MTIREQIAAHTKETEEIIKKFLPKEEGYQRTVLEAMNYSFLAGGKRLRPMLMLETYRLFGGTGRIVEPFMAAQEMIHTYSLIHDDLPAMDDDEYRRGRKTTHIVYGEAMAILAGDALLNYAYETAAKAFDDPEADARVMKAYQILAKKAGIYGMVGGQVVDVESEGQPIDADKLHFIYEYKTGALLESSMTIGAVLAGASAEQVAVIEAAASDFGHAFQIQDDILDIVSTTEELGKPVGSDEKNQKTTYVSIHGLEKSGEDVRRLFDSAIASIESLPYKNAFLIDLLKALVDRRK